MRSHQYFADTISQEEFRCRGIRPLIKELYEICSMEHLKRIFGEKRTCGGGGGHFWFQHKWGDLKKVF